MTITCFISACSGAQSQSSSQGAISGRLTDLYSRPLDGVSLVLSNDALPAQVQTTTGKNGVYRFTQLQPGEYVLEAVSPRDGRAHMKGIVIIAGYEAHVRLALHFDGNALANSSELLQIQTALADTRLNSPTSTPAEAVPRSVILGLQAPPKQLVMDSSSSTPRSGLNAEPHASETRGSDIGRSALELAERTGPIVAPNRSPSGPARSEPTDVATLATSSTHEAQLVVHPSLAAALPSVATALSPAWPTLLIVSAEGLNIGPVLLSEAPLPEARNRAAAPISNSAYEPLTTTLSGEQLQQLPLAGRDWALIANDAGEQTRDQRENSNDEATEIEVQAVTIDGTSFQPAFGSGAARSGSSVNGTQGHETQIIEMQSSAFVLDAASAGNKYLRVETNRGTNALHGQAFFVDRQNFLGARNPSTVLVKETTPASLASTPVFTSSPYTPSDRQVTWGVGAGSALRRNHLFWFAAFDGNARENPAVSMVRHPEEFFAQPSNDEMQVLSARLGAGGTRPIAAGIAAYSQELESLATLLGPAPRTSAQWSAFGRIDWNVAERHRVTFEANNAHFDADGGGFTRSSIHYGNHSLGNVQARELWSLVRWDAFLTPNLLFSSQGSFGRHVLRHSAETPSFFEQSLNASAWGQLPQLIVDSRYGFTIGNPASFSAGTYPDEHLYQARETVDWVHGSLLLKAGVELRHNADATTMLRNHTGTYHYAHVENFISDALVFQKFGMADALDPAHQHNCDQRGGAWRDATGQLHGLGYLPCYSYYTQTLGPTDWHLSTTDWAAFITAQWQPAKRLVFSTALRWDRQLVPPPIPLVDNPDLPLTRNLPALGNQWGPRVSVAWGTHESLWPTLSAGYGLYFNRTRNSVLEAALTQTGSLKGDLNFFVRPTDNLQNQSGGAPPFPYVFTGAPASAVKPGAVELGPGFRNPQVHQVIATIEQRLPGRVGLSISGVGSLARHLPVTLDTNIDESTNPQTITYAVVDPSGKGPFKTSQLTVPFYASWPSSHGGNGRAHTNYQQISQTLSRANSTYQALIVHLTRASRSGINFRARYTYGHATDWNPNETDQLNGSSVLDPANFSQEFGTSDLDVRHSASATLTWETPWKMRSSVGYLANGWRFSTIGQFHSGLPYTMRTAGSIPREFTSTGAMILGLGPSVNGYGGDNRLYSVARNTYRYPDAWKADIRIGRRFAFGHDRELEALAESFNLFNHQNITQLETIGYYIEPGGQSGTMPSLHFLTGLKTGQTEFGKPLDINGTNYYRPRQFDFGVRLRF